MLFAVEAQPRGEVMPYWAPIVAVFGLACLMIIPAPGIEGLVIGCICVLIIVVSAVLLLLDRLASRVLVLAARVKKRSRRPGRAVHAGSGIARKVRAEVTPDR